MGGETEGPKPPSLTVLVADPSPDNADSLAWVLGACGHRARTAGTVTAALAAAAAEPPDAVVMEVLFPDGDAFDLSARLTAGRPARPLLVLLTGRTVPGEALPTAGFDAHFLKPADPALLVDLLAGRVNRADAGPPK